MLIDDLDKDILEKGFLMPRFIDGIRIIWHCDVESFYRFILLVFYLLGCFQTRFYQYEMRSSNYWLGRETIRCALFHPYIWNPISVIAGFIFQIMNYFYVKNIIYIYVAPSITIDVKNNRAYIIHIRNRE
jgi:hypothetical protein